MKKNVFYVLRGEVQQSRFNKPGVLEIFKVFKHEKASLARDIAFRTYQNYVEVFLESCGHKYESHDHSCKVLSSFFFPWSKQELKAANSFVDTTGELKLYLVIGDEVAFRTKAGVEYYKNEFEIHGITNEKDNLSHEQLFFKNLLLEHKLYKMNSFVIDGQISEYDVSGLFEKPILVKIMTTPINFNKMLSDTDVVFSKK